MHRVTDDEIRAAMAYAQGRITAAAARLGISRQAVHQRCARLGIAAGPRPSTRGRVGKRGTQLTKIEETGHVYGRLTVLAESRRSEKGEWSWRCRCECGAELWVRGSMLRSHRTRSCGCLQRETTRAMGLANRGRTRVY